MANNLVAKMRQNYLPLLHLSLCHPETEWDFALRIHTLIAPLIVLHRVKMVKIGSVVFELVGEKMKIVLQIDQNRPTLPNISTTSEPDFTNVSAFVDVYMRIIKLT